MLKNDAIYNSSFRFQDIDFNNINDIYFAINIIIIIMTTLFKVFIVVIFVFKLIIIIIIIIDVDIAVTLIIVFEKPILKLIAFDFNIKKRFIMNAPLDKS